MKVNANHEPALAALRAYATESTPVPVSRYSYNGPKALLAGASLFIGGICVAVLAGAIGAEALYRYIEQRR